MSLLWEIYLLCKLDYKIVVIEISMGIGDKTYSS